MAKGKTKSRIPKRIGGVKVPKKLRKNANRALELADNPVVRDAASAALLAGATKLIQSLETAFKKFEDKEPEEKEESQRS